MFTKEMVLQFLQARGINILSLDAEGVEKWGAECRKAVEDGFPPPAATFRLDVYNGVIEYISGSGDTRILIPGPDSRDECQLFSVREDAHVERLSLEVSRLFPPEDYEKGFRSDVVYHIGADPDFEGRVLLQCRQWYDTTWQSDILGFCLDPTYF